MNFHWGSFAGVLSSTLLLLTLHQIKTALHCTYKVEYIGSHVFIHNTLLLAVAQDLGMDSILERYALRLK